MLKSSSRLIFPYQLFSISWAAAAKLAPAIFTCPNFVVRVNDLSDGFDDLLKIYKRFYSDLLREL